MDVTRFLREGAKYMAADRPDIWDIEQAFGVLTKMFSYLAGLDEPTGEVITGGFALIKYIDPEDETIEYKLDKQILSLALFPDEDSLLTDWTDCSAISNIGLDIPDDSIDNDY